VLIVAAILRAFRLDTFPPGLYADVAANGIDALGVPQHGIQVIYPRGAGNGIEGMISWLDAISVALLGPKPIALYLTTVVIGLVTLPVHYLLATSLFGRRIGLISVALLAVSFWAVHYSRLGYRTALVPLRSQADRSDSSRGLVAVYSTAALLKLKLGDLAQADAAARSERRSGVRARASARARE